MIYISWLHSPLSPHDHVLRALIRKVHYPRGPGEPAPLDTAFQPEGYPKPAMTWRDKDGKPTVALRREKDENGSRYGVAVWRGDPIPRRHRSKTYRNRNVGRPVCII